MEEQWAIAVAYQSGQFAQRCATLDAVFELQGECVSRDRISDVIKVAMDGRNFYVKRYYKSRTRSLGRFMRSRIRAEWENLAFFDSLGIPTPKMAAYGEAYRGTTFKGALITEEVRDTQDLATLSRSAEWLFADRDWWQHTAKKVASYTRLLHEQQFMHVDLKWRNILVAAGERPEVYFFDCPSGKRLPAWLFRRGRLKDLACLDKIGRTRLRRSQRLAFYKYYVGRDKLSVEDKAMVRKVARFSAYLEGESTESGWRFF